MREDCLQTNVSCYLLRLTFNFDCKILAFFFDLKIHFIDYSLCTSYFSTQPISGILLTYMEAMQPHKLCIDHRRALEYLLVQYRGFHGLCLLLHHLQLPSHEQVHFKFKNKFHLFPDRFTQSPILQTLAFPSNKPPITHLTHKLR